MGIAVNSERGTRPAQDAPSPKITPECTHGRRDRAPRDKVRAFPPRDPFFSSFLFFSTRALSSFFLFTPRARLFLCDQFHVTQSSLMINLSLAAAYQ